MIPEWKEEIERMVAHCVEEEFARRGFSLRAPLIRLSSESRYQHDVHFRTLVDVMHSMLEQTSERGVQYTPTEMREAALLAVIKYEAIHVRPFFAVMDRRTGAMDFMGDR